MGSDGDEPTPAASLLPVSGTGLANSCSAMCPTHPRRTFDLSAS